MPNGKVMVIGLDAATLDLVRPFAAEGLLPNLKRFLESGATGPLRSTLPVHSSAAWSTFATGTNPGKHGIADFLQFTPDSYKPTFVNATQRDGETFWEIAGKQGVRGGVINVPVTYPPREYNGFIISGVLSPGVTRQIASPPEVFDELLEVSPDYKIDVEIVKAARQDVRKEFYERILSTLQARLDAAIGLYRKYQPQLFCVVFRGADQASHYYWGDFEAFQSGNAKTETERRLGEAIPTVYRRLDDAVGALVAEADKETDVLILSDHGAGPLRKGLNLQEVLVQHGLLVRSRSKLISSIVRKLAWVFVSRAPLSWKNRLKANWKGLARRVAGTTLSSGIDFTRTKAYPTCDSEGIFVNLKNRQPQGIVAPEDYESVRDEVIQVFSELIDPETDRKVTKKVYRREEVWSGANLEKLPDLILEQSENTYYTTQNPNMGESIFYPLPKSSPVGVSWNGSHRRNGLLMAMGPHIRRTDLSNAEIADVPATILGLLGCDIPDNFDGRVLTEMLTDDIKPSGTIVASSDRTADKDVYSEQEQAALQKRLEGLGYL
ncbi:MAG: alkaline phosphatase family protein [Planctomycetota bacterium]|jgi:predicted AlkP superfamily phosphohydrolase/phosphomutase